MDVADSDDAAANDDEDKDTAAADFLRVRSLTDVMVCDLPVDVLDFCDKDDG